MVIKRRDMTLLAFQGPKGGKVVSQSLKFDESQSRRR